MAKPCRFENCPYNGRTVVPFHGPRPTDIMIVGEAPGQEEIRRGKPFVGASGHVLNAVLEENGLYRSTVYVANSCRCIIDKDKDPVKMQNAALKVCRAYLRSAVRAVKPKLIVTVGAVALKQVLGIQQIMKNRGSFFHSPEFDCQVFCTVHPAYVLRGSSYHFWEKPATRRSMKEQLLFSDFSRVKAFFVTPGTTQEINLDAYTQGTKEDAEELQGMSPIAVDFETTGLELKNPKVKALSVSFSSKEGESVVFLANKHGKFPVVVNRLLKDPETQKIVAARPFEENCCRDLLGFEMRGRIHDVLEMAHLLDENSYSYGLEAVADIYTPLKGIKDIAEGMRGNLADLPVEKLINYNGVDTDATLRAFNTMRKVMKGDTKLLRYYASFMQKIQTMFAGLSASGCALDTKQLAADERELNELIDTLHEECIDMIPCSIKEDKKHAGKLRLSRDSIVRDYLFLHKDGLRLKPLPAYMTPKTKVPQCSEDHMAFFPGHGFIEKYIRMRKAKKIVGTYIKNYWKALKPDGRVYPTTLLNATVTGRCLTGDANVLTTDGNVPIKSIVDNKLKPEVITHKGRVRKVLDSGPNGRRPVFKITTKSGKVITATANHPFFTRKGWMCLEDLTIGDSLIILEEEQNVTDCVGINYE